MIKIHYGKPKGKDRKATINQTDTMRARKYKMVLDVAKTIKYPSMCICLHK